MNLEMLRHELQVAREELSAATAALAPKHKGGEWERYRLAHDRCIALERDVARAAGEECAVEIDWSPRWSAGAPLPHVVSSSSSTFVIYHMSVPDPNWDGSYIRVVDPSVSNQHPIAIVTFDRCLVHKFGAPNDEAISGHPLHGRGLQPYRAHIVERSRWIIEQETINSVHPQHNGGWDKVFKHYVLAFHDETFECIAAGHSVQAGMSTFAQALEECVRRVLA